MNLIEIMFPMAGVIILILVLRSAYQHQKNQSKTKQ
jgi:hypothetical protein